MPGLATGGHVGNSSSSTTISTANRLQTRSSSAFAAYGLEKAAA